MRDSTADYSPHPYRALSVRQDSRMFLPDIIVVPQSGNTWTDPAVIASLFASVVALAIAVWGNKKNDKIREEAGRERDKAQAMLVLAIPEFDLKDIALPPSVFKDKPEVFATQFGYWIRLQNLGSDPILLPSLTPHIANLSFPYRFTPDVENRGIPSDTSDDVHVLKPGQSLIYFADSVELPGTQDFSIQFQLPSGRWVKKTGSNIEFISKPEMYQQQIHGLYTPPASDGKDYSSRAGLTS